MNKVKQRIELVALAQKNKFALSLVKNKYEPFIGAVKKAQELSIDLTELERCEEIQREILENEHFMDVINMVCRSNKYSERVLELLLSKINENGDCASNYTPEQFYESFNIRKYFWKLKDNISIQYMFLKYFSKNVFAKNKKVRIVKSLMKLSPSFDLLCECFADNRSTGVLCSKFYSETSLVDKDCETIRFLINNENARKFIVYLYSKEYDYFNFGVNELKQVSDEFDMLIPNLKQIYFAIGYSNFEVFLSYWRKNGLSLAEVQMLVRRINNSRPSGDTFSSEASYINYLCGSRLKGFDFENLQYGQSELLIYAILNNKKSFLRLVKDNYKLFTDIPADSVLFNVRVYKTILNLNTLNARNLKEFSNMHDKDFQRENFEERNYTFDEFKVLYNAEEQYGKLYNLLKISRIDDRLVVIRELLKRRLLSSKFSDKEYEQIDEKLSVMPLSRWYKEEYFKISDLLLGDVINILADFELIEKFREEIKTRKDVYCIIRNKSYAKVSKSLKDMINKILNNDIAWLELKKVMGLSDDFVKNNRKTIAEFVFNGNAEIANEYYPCLKNTYKEAFFFSC